MADRVIHQVPQFSLQGGVQLERSVTFFEPVQRLPRSGTDRFGEPGTRLAFLTENSARVRIKSQSLLRQSSMTKSTLL
jgi:hypothetical protein